MPKPAPAEDRGLPLIGRLSYMYRAARFTTRVPESRYILWPEPAQAAVYWPRSIFLNRFVCLIRAWFTIVLKVFDVVRYPAR